jgi:rare lipoprotein A
MQPLNRSARPNRGLIITLCVTALVGACAAGRPAIEVVDRPYPLPVLTQHGTEIGLASWYGPGFHGNVTASGERYDQDAMTAAHRSLPLGTLIEVRNRDTGRSIQVRVNDRGPYHTDRVLDLSREAARALGSLDRGVAPVEIRILQPQYAAWPSVRYTVQLAAFGDRSRAERVARSLARYNAHVSADAPPAAEAGESDEHRIYRVRVGSYTERSSAARAADALRQRGYEPFVVEIIPRPADTTRVATPGTNPT